MLTIPDGPLRNAATSYAAMFGHEVPDTVIAMYASRPGALVNEIRQAVHLVRPIPGWRELARRSMSPATGAVR